MTSPRHDPSHEKRIVSFAVHLPISFSCLSFLSDCTDFLIFIPTIVSGIFSALHFRRESVFASLQTRLSSGMASAALFIHLNFAVVRRMCLLKHIGSVLLSHFAYTRRFDFRRLALALQHMNLELPTGNFSL